MSTFTPWSAAVGGTSIGLAATLLMAATGRIAGVSGFVSRLLPPYEDGEAMNRLAFVAGLLSSPICYEILAGQQVAIDISTNLPLLVLAGALVGFGAVLGSGCTSGHGVCGTARLSTRSLAATATFMAVAMVTVYVRRHLLGS